MPGRNMSSDPGSSRDAFAGVDRLAKGISERNPHPKDRHNAMKQEERVGSTNDNDNQVTGKALDSGILLQVCALSDMRREVLVESRKSCCIFEHESSNSYDCSFIIEIGIMAQLSLHCDSLTEQNCMVSSMSDGKKHHPSISAT